MKGIDVIVEQAGSRYQIAVVRVLGQIDTTTSHELERRLQYLLKDHQSEIVIDLSKVSYISSAGWGIFISEIRGIRESGGDLKLASMTPEVAEVFELLEFHNILESFRTVEEAVERFEKPKAVPQSQKQSSKEGAVSSNGLPIVSEEQILDETTGATVAPAPEGLRSDDDEATSTVPVVTPGEERLEEPKATHPAGARESHEQAKPEASQQMGPEVSGQVKPVPTSSQTRMENGQQTELEVVDPDNPDVTGQIEAEVVEEAKVGEHTRPADDKQMRWQQTGLPEPVSEDFESAIFEIAREHPEYGCLRMRGELQRRGYRRPINPLSLFMELKRLNLETKEKRRHYADSFSATETKK